MANSMYLETVAMQTLPIELLAYICEFVSEQDDGLSIRSLSLVSTQFYDISEPYLFRRVALSGPAQISAFAARLKRDEPGRRMIRDLFLADSPLGAKSPEPIGATNASKSTQLSRNISQILAYASPTLVALTAHLHSQRGPSLIARILRTSMPHLRILSISGLYPFPSSSSHFPRLESLSLDGNRNPVGLLSMAGLEEAFPVLKALSVTGIESVAFALEVEAIIPCSRPTLPDIERMEPSVSFTPSMQAVLPHGLKSLVLQAGPKNAARSEISRLKTELQQSSTTRSDGAEFKVYVLDPPATAIRASDMRDMWCR